MLGSSMYCEGKQKQELGVESWILGGGAGWGVSSFKQKVRDGRTGKVTFEKRPKTGKGMSCGIWNSKQEHSQCKNP